MRIVLHKQKCSGCRICEMVCSLRHFGVVNPERSAIRIRKDDLGTGLNTPRLCLQCAEPKMSCLQGFPPGSMDAATAKKSFFWKRSCVPYCPYDGIFPWGDMALHCNLCDGDPQCVKFCTPGAISVRQQV